MGLTSVTLTHDQLDQIVVDRLKDSYSTLLSAISVLKSKDSLQQYEIKDLEAHRRDLRATRRVLRYFMVAKEFEDFLESL